MTKKEDILLFEKHSSELREVLGDVSAFHSDVYAVVDLLKKTFKKGNKVLIAGNGGSAAEAQHFSDEMVGRYQKNRQGYPVIALTCDGAVLTCVGNDYGYDKVFSRQVEALGKKGDVFIGLTTSGTSKNIITAARVAKKNGMKIISFTGPVGLFQKIADVALVAPSKTPPRMQEFHLHAIHLICECFES